MRRTVVFIVLDSVGVGALPDADLYGDQGSNTLRSVLDYNKSLTLPNLAALGMGAILPHSGLVTPRPPLGAYGRGMTASPAKDTITGHWEMAGIVLGHPFRTFPAGFPTAVVRALAERTGRQFLGNVAASGTEIIRDLGREHQVTGAPILYTSADSVMQIAAHEETVPLAELYHICQVARELMQGEFNVARVIARPFNGEWPYVRTPNRRDLAVAPPGQTMLDIIAGQGLPVVGIGKICDIYAGHGPTRCLKSKNNREGMVLTESAYRDTAGGLVFTNLVDYDQLYGHRNDAAGYGRALKEFDDWLGDFLGTLRETDYLFLAADHGCDPLYAGTDHTREYVPILAYSREREAGRPIGDRATLADIGATILDVLGFDERLAGTSFRAEWGALP